MTQISILGCGWLGLPLAKAMIANGSSIKGSTTSEDKLSQLKSVGIAPFLINLSPHSTKTEQEITSIQDFLNGSKTVIINIPPQLRGKNIDALAAQEKVFVSKIKNLIPFIEESTIENVLFVSSTSVYGEADGSVNEETIAKPETESGKQLLEVESLLLNNTNFKTTILRFGGLIGEDRNPARFMAGKVNIENPETPINFIHQEDCIGIILKILSTNSWNEIYNGVSPFHPTREVYYTQKAIESGLPLPTFDHSKSSSKKIVTGEKIEKVLGYNFIKADL